MSVNSKIPIEGTPYIFRLATRNTKTPIEGPSFSSSEVFYMGLRRTTRIFKAESFIQGLLHRTPRLLSFLHGVPLISDIYDLAKGAGCVTGQSGF